MKSPVSITIVTPSYNQGQFIGETIESIVTQDYPECEYFIIDACSSDNSATVISRYKESIDWWLCEPDNGQADAINKGLMKASGELFAWVNSDDILLPNCLTIVNSYFSEKKHPDIITGNILYIDEHGFIKRFLNMKKQSRFFLSKGVWYAAAPVVFFNTKKLIEYGCLNASLRLCMDLDVWIRFLVQNAKVVHIPHYLGCFRIHTTSKGQIAIHTSNDVQLEREMLYRNAFPILTVSENKFWRNIYRAKQLVNLCYIKEIFAKMSIGNAHWKKAINNRLIFHSWTRA
jgi:glycosyltransferase involved in cell wall biosynthesis